MAGLTDYAETAALEALFPDGGSNRYVGFFTVLPDDDGTGGTEATGSSYARVAHNQWIDGTSGDETQRKNDGAITFTALTGDLLGIVGWGIWDASTAGNLLAFGEMLDSQSQPITRNFYNGDQPRFSDQNLKIGLD